MQPMQNDDRMEPGPAAGPLAGIRVLELAGIGPAPFCCMLLADMGAEVLRVDRPTPADFGLPGTPELQLLNRGRRSIAVDLKDAEGVALVRQLVAQADVLLEGFRPGVTERLGLGPDEMLALNPRLVYGRMTGWGQDGPLAQRAGHDINYIGLTGALDAIGTAGGAPVPPLNLVGDFGGGALYLAFGIACALLESRTSGKGQVVDAAIVDGTSSLLTAVFGKLADGAWSRQRGDNLLSGGRPWYGVYETRDGRHVSVGAVEQRFYLELLERTGLASDPGLRERDDPQVWPRLRERLAAAFRSRTRDEWTEVMAGSDACVAPVLTVDEAPADPHLRARSVHVERAGVLQPAPAPRLSRTPAAIGRPPPRPGEHTLEVLRELGFAEDRIRALFDRGAVS
jgi:alpha-methylacyl-CoA racemase